MLFTDHYSARMVGMWTCNLNVETEAGGLESESSLGYIVSSRPA